MAGPESQFWKDWVRPALSGWDPVRVETPDKDGFPDVSHIPGLLELKAEREWPTRPGTVFRVDHFTAHQRVFHKRRWKAGGLIHVLIRVKQDVLLIRGGVAADWLGKMPKEQTIKLASAHWHGKQQMMKGLKDAILSDTR